MRANSVLITAGFDKAPHAVALAELLLRDGFEVSGVLVVSPFSIRRVRSMLRQHGAFFILRSLKRLFGIGGGSMKKSLGHENSISRLKAREKLKHTSLRRWAREHGITYQCVSSINDDVSTDFVSKSSSDWVVYAGGGILRNRFIDAANGCILNAHSGPLPEIRGMNACEWSLLLGQKPGVTIHMINRGIDTGSIMKFFPLPMKVGDTIEDLRSRCVALGVEGIREVLNDIEAIDPKEVDPVVSRQCFVLSAPLKKLLEGRLAKMK